MTKFSIRTSDVVIVFLTFCVSWIGSLFTSSGMNGWYESLTLPSFTPSGSIIGVVWTALFILSALAIMMIWRKKEVIQQQQGKHFFRTLMVIIFLNAFLNISWSHVFFVTHGIGEAVLYAGLLSFTVYAISVLVWPFARPASLLLLPYALWTSFATYLNYCIWTLN